MGIFNDKHAKTNGGTETTVIATNCHIDGTFTIDGCLHVDGHLSGRIECNGTITIGSSGYIGGEIDSEKVLISGKYNGDCRSKLVQILKGGLVEGTLYTEQLVIEPGGNFYGDSRNFSDKKTGLSLVHDAEPANTAVSEEQDAKKSS